MHISIPRRVNPLSPSGLDMFTTSIPVHNFNKLHTNGCMKMSMLSAVGDFMPGINITSDIKNFFVNNHGGRLSMVINNTHVECLMALFLNGIMPSPTRPSRRFVSTWAKSGYMRSIVFHCGLSDTHRLFDPGIYENCTKSCVMRSQSI